MSASDIDDRTLPQSVAPPKQPPVLGGFWQWITSGVTFGAIGTLFFGIFQYYTSYQEKVASLAKDDLTSATSTFIESFNALSVAQSLQERLIFSFYDPKHDDLKEYAHELYRDYAPAYSKLRANNTILANNIGLWLDEPNSDRRDTTTSALATADSLTVHRLEDISFDCQHDVPNFKAKKQQNIDWRIAKYHVLTIYYCFNLIHRKMEIVREWALGKDIKGTDRKDFMQDKNEGVAVKETLDQQVVRLNAFRALAAYQIERIRDRFRPNGFLCDAPLVGSAIEMLTHRCQPSALFEAGGK